MIPLSKRQIRSNLLWVVFFGLFFFTPVGFHTKVLFARVFSFSASPLPAEEQLVFSNYDWQLTTLDGTNTDLSDAKGTVVLINFWATWCAPCIAEMPAFEKLFDDYGNQMTFVFVTNDKTSSVKKYLEKRKSRLPVFFANVDVPEVLYSKSIPATYILDQNGTLVLSKIGVADWNSEKTRVLLDGLVENQFRP